jgi:hypothetical protein
MARLRSRKPLNPTIQNSEAEKISRDSSTVSVDLILHDVGLRHNDEPERDRIEGHDDRSELDLRVRKDGHHHKEYVQVGDYSALSRDGTEPEPTFLLPKPQLRFLPFRLNHLFVPLGPEPRFQSPRSLRYRLAESRPASARP